MKAVNLSTDQQNIVFGKMAQANKHGQRGGSCVIKAKELTFVSSESQKEQIFEAVYTQSWYDTEGGIITQGR